MWKEMKRVYADAAGFAVAVPLLFAIPLAAEFVQHVIEYRVGMFDSFAAAEASGEHPARMGFGYVKVLTLFLLGYFVPRYMLLGRDPAVTARLERVAVASFAGVLLFQVTMALLSQGGGALVSAAALGDGVTLAIGIAAFLGFIAFELWLVAWKVAAPLGDRRISIPASFGLMRGHIMWGFGFTLLMLIPLMVAHYALNIGAIGRAAPLMWGMLGFDALLTAYLGVVIAAANVAIARRAAEQAGVTLGAGRSAPALA